MSVSFTGANLCSLSFSFLLLYFLHATDALSPDDVNLTALCNQFDFQGYGIYLLFTFYATFTVLNCIKVFLGIVCNEASLQQCLIHVCRHGLHEWTFFF